MVRMTLPVRRPGRPPRIDARSARLYLAVVETGSIAGAAAREHIAASAVSRRLAELEAAFGVALVERHRRGILLTHAGEALAHHARMIEQAVDRMNVEMGEYIAGIRGHVRVRASASSFAAGFADDIERFMLGNRQVRLELEEQGTPEVFRDVTEGLADIGVAPNLAPHADLTLIPYRPYALAAVVPSGHPLADRKSVRFRQLLDFDLVELARGSALGMLLTSAALQTTQPKRTRIRMTGFDGVCRMVAIGMGVGVLPAYLGQLAEWQARLRFVVLDEAWARSQLCIAVRSLDTLPQAARALIDHLRLTAAASA